MEGVGAVLNVFEIYFELRFATSQDVKAGANLELIGCAMDGHAYQKSVTTQTPPDGYIILENIADQTPPDGYTNP